MELTINSKKYNFKFGTKFIREIDKRFSVEHEGMKFGFGLASKVLPELQSFNIATLSDVLYLANRTEENELTIDDIDTFVEEVKDIEKLFDQVFKDLEKSNAGKLALRMFKKNLQQEQSE